MDKIEQQMRRYYAFSAMLVGFVLASLSILGVIVDKYETLVLGLGIAGVLIGIFMVFAISTKSK